MKNKFLVAALSIVLLSWPRTAGAVDCPTFGGRATAVQANVLGIVPVVLSDTGSLDSTGGAKQASLLNASIAGLLSGKSLHATSIGGGSNSQSEASVANLVLTVAGNTIGADFIMARASAYCGSVSPTVSAITEIHGLKVNGLSIPVTGLANQTVALLGGGLMTINEQTSSVQGQLGSIAVNALHLRVPAVIDAVVAAPFVVIGGPPDPV
ncbi:MAG TPA: choice-of-anchor P family protein, partial [Terriglobia bacterium]|nr:choice-of-anchor P family protein [Terriglobia bacterium]